MIKRRLAIITTHPIQYNAPLFKLLSERKNIDIKVFYTWGSTARESKFDPGFGKMIMWDIPLEDGYEFEYLANTAVDKGSHHFNGIINPDIEKRINAFEPDALLIFGWSFKSHRKVLRFFKNKKLILFRGDSTLLDPSPFFKRFIKAIFLKWIYRAIDVALYTGLNNYEYYKEFGIKDSQLKFAPHAIDNNRFSRITKEDEEQLCGWKKEMDIKDEDCVFLFAGKLEAKKGVSDLLRSFSQSVFPKNVHLVIVGNGNLESILKEEYEHRPGIHFMDFQNQRLMPVVYRLADVFVLPSVGPGETWGLAVNEAMVSGRPVLVSDKCGCAVDLVENGVNGYIFQAGDQLDLMTKLRQLVEQDKDGLKKMGEKSLSKISEFSFDKICEVIENLVTEKEASR